MPTPTARDKINTGRYYVLSPIIPFVDISLQSIAITKREFTQIKTLAAGYQNDPRMIEMVRKGGDASAKVPYLLAAGETADSILATLRKIVQPHVERLQSLPESIQATIHLLLSINTVPRGCEVFGIPALLEVDRMQAEIIQSLHEKMVGRQLANEFHKHNSLAFQKLDKDWPRIRELNTVPWANTPLPEQSQIEYTPLFDKNGRLLYVKETCVIIDSPDQRMLKKLTPAVLQNPLPPNIPIPIAGSADWLIRYVGKIGRHFTRALLGIIKLRLETEAVALDTQNYDLITKHALEAMREYIENNP
jgi:hypothetical protein